MFSIKEIRELIDMVADRGLGGLEIERSGFRLRIDGRPRVVAEPVAAAAPELAAAAAPAGASTPRAAGAAAPAPEPEPDADENVHVVTSPIVGTFYRSPSPEADPFAQIGERISKGKILCIIESMKLMNEIESDIDGVIVRIYPQNGQPVEYGEKLFAVKV